VTRQDVVEILDRVVGDARRALDIASGRDASPAEIERACSAVLAAAGDAHEAAKAL
jgi:hypothetical protein